MKKLAATVLLAALAAPSPGCGKRGDPRPPLRKTPPPLSAFAVAQRGGRLEVSGTAPRTSTEGAALSSVRVELLRAEGEGDFLKLARRREISLGAGESFREPEPLPAPGTLLRLAARVVASGRPSVQTAVLSFVAQPALPVPAELAAAAAPDGVRLTWTGKVPPPLPAPPTPAPTATPVPNPIATTPTGSAPKAPPTPPAKPAPRAGFVVYRRPADGLYSRPLAPEPIDALTTVDAGASQGLEWCYVVRTTVSQDPPIESDDSNEACLVARDVQAPAPPGGLTALAQPGALEIRWSPSPEPDLAVYRVYRASASGGPERLAEVPAGTTVFADTAAAPGVLYRYTVTAVDRAGNESAPSAPLLGNTQ